MSKKVAVIMGSDSDLPVVEKAIATLKEFYDLVKETDSMESIFNSFSLLIFNLYFFILGSKFKLYPLILIFNFSFGFVFYFA